MADYAGMQQLFMTQLGMSRVPIAVAFRNSAPQGVAKFAGSEPSSCSFWRLAASGRVFYTVPGDHYNCPIGSYVHNIPLPPDRAEELNQVLGLMDGMGYVRMEEVPRIPRLSSTPGAIVYAPLAKTPVDPDVVLFIGQASRMMLLNEAALRAGVSSGLPVLGRPTCMALPASLAQGVIASTGCIGNRAYTDVGEGELYMAVPGGELSRVADQVETIANANAQLLQYHRARREALATE